MILALSVFAAALFVDGATDCVNAAAGAVASKSMSLRGATSLCAAASFLGCFLFCNFFPAVADNTAAAVSIPENVRTAATVSALLAVAIWSGVAMLLALPTSEGQGLLFATAGAAASLGGEADYPALFLIIVAGIPAAALGVLFSLLSARIFGMREREAYRIPVVISCGASAFFHGAQDGQKFLALMMHAPMLFGSYFGSVLFASAFMGVGTLFGSRIIRKTAVQLAKANKVSALSCDMGSTAALSVLTFLGIPASTTQIKMLSLFFATRFCGEKTAVAPLFLMIGSWIATLPVCFALSYFISKVICAFFL